MVFRYQSIVSVIKLKSFVKLMLLIVRKVRPSKKFWCILLGTKVAKYNFVGNFMLKLIGNVVIMCRNSVNKNL